MTRKQIRVAALVAAIVVTVPLFFLGRSLVRSFGGITVNRNDPLVRAMEGRGGEQTASFYVPPGTPLLGRGVGAFGFVRPLGGSGLDVIVTRCPEGSPHAIQLQVVRTEGKTYTGDVHSSRRSASMKMGTPRLFCDLNESQAKQLIANDFPDSLVQALIAASADVRWEGQVIRPGLADIRVDPAPHFAD